MSPRPEILLYACSAYGGIAEYAFAEAEALRSQNISIQVLAARNFLPERRPSFPLDRTLHDLPGRGKSRLLHRVKVGATLVANQFRLAYSIVTRRPRIVLLDSYQEYGAPVWIWPHILLAKLCRVRYVAVLHDPVRNFQIGPRWWHRLSVYLAYAPLEAVIGHELHRYREQIPARVTLIEVDHGMYSLPPLHASREQLRHELGIPPDRPLFLAFGFIRDGKNLHLAIEALRDVPSAVLLIAGAVASQHDRPVSYYQELARSLGVADQVLFREGFVSEAMAAAYFSAADFVLLGYAGTFQSQSGVLHLAAAAERPVLASSGPGPLQAAVEQYALGLSVAPDSTTALAEGMRRLLHSPPRPRWEQYQRDHSWDRHAQQLLKALRLTPSQPNSS